MSLKEWARNFDVQDFRDGADAGTDYGSVGRGSDARTVRDYCRDWAEHYDDLPVSLYLDGRPFWGGLEPVQSIVRINDV